MTKPRLFIVGTVGVPAKYGGFETLAEYILEDLVREFEVTVFCEKETYQGDAQKTYKGARLKYIPLKANGSQSVLYDITALLKSLRVADFILILGVSGTIVLPLLKHFTRAKIITNIDGLEWQREKWGRKAKKFLKWSEKMAVKHSDLVISDNQFIQEYVMDEYAVPSTLIAYGGDHVTKESNGLWQQKYPFITAPYAFTVCRIEPENNLEMIIKAYLASNQEIPYVLVGNWKASVFGMELLKRYQNRKKLFLLDPIYDQKELNVLRSNCTFYLHGHSAGGTNPSLVEAMYLGLPIIAYGVNYNLATTFKQALYFNTAQDLTKILDSLNQNDLKYMGQKLKKYSEENYLWKYISVQYVEAILSQGTKS